MASFLSLSLFFTVRPRPRPAATKPEAQPCPQPAAPQPESRPRPAAPKPEAPAAPKPEPQPCPRPAATVPRVDPICQARLPLFGRKCPRPRSGSSRWCALHRPYWHQKDSPVWVLTPGTTVLDFAPTICLAWVNATGMRCSNPRCGPSRWCSEHSKKWTGKLSPAWCPCP